MTYTPKFMYGPHRLEKSDTNDLVEDLIKGGPGSGRKKTSAGRDALGNKLAPGEENARTWAGQPMTRDYAAKEKRKKELEQDRRERDSRISEIMSRPLEGGPKKK